MHLYSVGYHSYEDSGDVTLLHEKEFTKEEFERITLECAIEAVKRRVAKPKNPDEYDSLSSWSDMYGETADVMCELHGFVMGKYSASFSAFGWPSMFDNSDWDGQRGESLIKVTNAMNGAGFDRKTDTSLVREDERKEEREREQNDATNSEPGDGTEIEGTLGDLQEGQDHGVPEV